MVDTSNWGPQNGHMISYDVMIIISYDASNGSSCFRPQQLYPTAPPTSQPTPSLGHWTNLALKFVPARELVLEVNQWGSKYWNINQTGCFSSSWSWNVKKKHYIEWIGEYFWKKTRSIYFRMIRNESLGYDSHPHQWRNSQLFGTSKMNPMHFFGGVFFTGGQD